MSTSRLFSAGSHCQRTPRLLGSGVAGTLALLVLLSGCGSLPSSSSDAGSAPTPDVAAEEPRSASGSDDETDAAAPEPSAAPTEQVETADTTGNADSSTETEPESDPAPETEEQTETEMEAAPPQSFSGTGSEVVILEPLDEEVLFATVTHSGSSNVALWSVDENGQDIDLLVNEIGNYEGQVAFNFRDNPAAVRIEADGEWAIDLAHLSEAPRWDGKGAYEAKGDSIVIVDGVADGLTPVTLTHDGKSNFAIWAWGESYPDLIVNDIGSYDGTTLLPDGSLVLQVSADGNWTISTN